VIYHSSMKHIVLIVFSIVICCNAHTQESDSTYRKVIYKREMAEVGTFQKSDFFIDTVLYFTDLDTNLRKYQLSVNFTKPENWKNADTKRLEESVDSYPNLDSLTFNDVKQIIDTTQSLVALICVKNWCFQNYSAAFPYLVSQLSCKTLVGLRNSADLIIWERFLTGDLQFYGHGWSINHDIFTAPGRASWILNELTGENFATVGVRLTLEEANEFKSRWVEYLAKTQD
jgi:hypothetical protein